MSDINWNELKRLHGECQKHYDIWQELEVKLASLLAEVKTAEDAYVKACKSWTQATSMHQEPT